MKKENRTNFCVSICVLIGFLLWTMAIRLIDVQAIGPCGSLVGFATINRFIHTLTGVHISLYTITDWFGLVPLGFVLGFGIHGLIQWIRRRKLSRVDYSILVLGGFYIVVMVAYIFFEVFVINYRPILIDGHLEASYPSSTTVLVLCVMPTAIMQFNSLIKNYCLKRIVSCIMIVFTIFMVVSRLISGVHWATDIIGGALLSAGLVLMYRAIIEKKNKNIKASVCKNNKQDV